MNIEDIIKKMTLHEKVMFCTGKNSWRTLDLPHLGVPSVLMSDGTSGVRFQMGSDDPKPSTFYDTLSGRFDDEKALNNTCEATAFPSGSAIACSWNKDLIRQVGRAIAAECRGIGIQLLLGPGINIRRHPLTARNFEYYSEDPCLAGDMAAAMVEGVQSLGVGTCMKHFACHNSDTRRTRVNVKAEERALREIYLAPYERVVKKADPTSVMSAYNKINGQECSGDNRYVRDILKKEWGFDGCVICDWGAVKDSVEASKGGIDLQMPLSPASSKYLEEAVQDGRLDEALLDERVRNILKLVQRLSESAPADSNTEADFDRHHKLAREAASESMVLLKNDRILPIRPGFAKKLAVAGLLAEQPLYQGTGCAIVRAKEVDIPLTAIKRYADEMDMEVTYVPGYGADGTIDPDQLKKAELAAREADLVLVFAGSFLPEEDDDYNRKNMAIQEGHEALIHAVSGANENTVVILSNGDVCEMPWEAEVKGLLDVWYSGEGMGQAVADILFGESNPSGRLSATIPFRLSDTPAYLEFPGNTFDLTYNEGIYVGYRYYDKKDVTPRYPFGYGLSYTNFHYSGLKAGDDYRVPGTYRVSVDITNRGAYGGKEVAQLYISQAAPGLPRPVRELKAFEKVYLDPGETKTVTFDLTERDFAYYDPESAGWVVDSDTFMIEIGASSRDIRESHKVQVYNEKKPVRRLRKDCGFAELLSTEQGREIFYNFLIERKLLTRDQINPETEKSFLWAFWPVRCFLDMGAGEMITYEMIDELIDRINQALENG